MITENQFVLSSFEKNFTGCKEKRMVLYGKGPYTKLILDICRDYNIIGIMDRDLVEGFIYDKPILSYSEVVEQKIELIVVIARPNSIRAVFERIHSFCAINHIQLYGINGKNLFEMFKIDQDSDENIVHVFQKEFISCKNKRIVLYGKGPRTQKIIEAFPNYNILGIMDRELKEGWCYGKPILSYDAIIEAGAEMIISVTRPWSTVHVYNRIGKFCAYNHILLYDVEGNDLFETMGKIREEVEPHPYFDVCEEQLKEQIVAHEIISFDIFDTLVMRKTLLPIDVFYIVEDKAKIDGIIINDFAKIRQKAEHDIIATHPNIYDIYLKVQELTGISNREMKWLIEKEVEVEKNVLICRDKMVEMLKYALSLKKRVYLISDMYLTSDILEAILSGLDICGYEKLYVSCEFNASKGCGLYGIYKRQVQGNSYLHIGDNRDADIYCANQWGIDGFYIKKAAEMLDISSYSPIRSYITNINERSMVGLFIAKVFNDPFKLYCSGGRPETSQLYEFGYLFFSPLVTDFVVWFIKEIRNRKYDDVLFASRDGYLIQRLYDIYKKYHNDSGMSNGIYFLTSRMTLSNALMEKNEDIEWLFAQPYNGESDDMIVNKFDISKDDLKPYVKKKYPHSVDYGLANKEVIFKKSKVLKDNLSKYYKQIGLNKRGKYAFVDLVSSGTCQMFMERIQAFDFDSYYLCFYKGGDVKRHGLKHRERYFVETVKNNSYLDYAEQNNTFNEYWFLEVVLTSEEPSTIGFDTNGCPVLGEEQRTTEELKFVHIMHEAIECYFEDYIENLYIEDIMINDKVADTIYSFKNLKYTNECCKELDDISLFEDMGHGRLPLSRH